MEAGRLQVEERAGIGAADDAGASIEDPAERTAAPGPGDARAWHAALSLYQGPDAARSLLEIGLSLGPFLLFWALGAWAVSAGHWLGLLLTLPAAGFLLRLFVVQHDCGHGTLFARRRANDWTGRLLGVLTLTPYDDWRRSHAVHHASAGNLDKRGIGDVLTLTLDEYRALSPGRRLRYRLYRHPLVMFGLAPAWLFLVRYRLPSEPARADRATWAGVLATDLALLLLLGPLAWAIGPLPVLAMHLPTALMAATAGVWLFFVQHQFEETHWARRDRWSLHHAALHGSSHLVLPAPLAWLTGWVGIHHVHHLSLRIPFYRLPRVLADHPALGEVGRVTWRDSLGALRLALWDERRRRLVPFAEAREQGA